MRKIKKVAVRKCGTTKIHFAGTHEAYRPKYELNKIRWEFNPYDDDSNPRWSIPHGDDIAPRYHSLKLNVYDGMIYTAKGHIFVGKLSKSERNRLLNDPRFKKVKDEAIKYRSGCLNKVQLKESSYVVDLHCYMIKNNNSTKNFC